MQSFFLIFFLYNYSSSTELYTLSLHDALPIYGPRAQEVVDVLASRHVAKPGAPGLLDDELQIVDRKSTRLNSSHRCISYAVFCLKKKKNTYNSKKTQKTERDMTKQLTIRAQQI